MPSDALPKPPLAFAAGSRSVQGEARANCELQTVDQPAAGLGAPPVMGSMVPCPCAGGSVIPIRYASWRVASRFVASEARIRLRYTGSDESSTSS